MMKILVTGGNGYIGARLCKNLASNGYRVTPLCHPVAPKDQAWADLMENVLVGDLRDDDFVSKIAGQEYDAIIHLVSLDHHQSQGRPQYVSSVNVLPTWKLLESFTARGSLKKFIYFSTVHIYGKPSELVVDEDVKRTFHIVTAQSKHQRTGDDKEGKLMQGVQCVMSEEMTPRLRLIRVLVYSGH